MVLFHSRKVLDKMTVGFLERESLQPAKFRVEMIGNLNVHIDGLVQDYSKSNALAMELLQSCTKLSMGLFVSRFVCLHPSFWGECPLPPIRLTQYPPPPRKVFLI